MNNRNIFAAAAVAALIALPTASQARVVDGNHYRHHHAERHHARVGVAARGDCLTGLFTRVRSDVTTRMARVDAFLASFGTLCNRTRGARRV
jgi:hypothetical protein